MADLNALIAQGAQFAAPVDPFAQYGKMQQLEQGQTTNQLNRMKMDEYQRGLQEQNAMRGAIPADFDINNPTHVNAVLRASPTAGAAFLEKFSQGAKERELASKAKNESLKFSLDNSRSFLVGVNDQPAYDAWRAYSVKNVPELEKMLPSVFTPEAKDSLLKTADDISKRLTAAPVATPLSKLITERNALPPGDPNRKLYDDAIQKESQFAPRAITNVNVNNEKAYGSVVAAGAGKEDLGAVERSRAIPQDFAKIDETLGVLRSGNLNTGLGADLFTVLDKARAQVASDKKAGVRSVNTEYLDSLLGSAVFPQIQALGIGARGMDTPAEREFLRKVMTGTISLNKDTLIKMTELRRKGLENEANQFNKQVDEGVFAPYEEAARRKVGKIAVPKTLQSGETSIPAGAIADLKAGRGNAEQFDVIFGKGSAQRVLGEGK